jgi:hypothetical protein
LVISHAGIRDIFQAQAIFTVAATEPLDFPAAERALAIV